MLKSLDSLELNAGAEWKKKELDDSVFEVDIIAIIRER